MSQKFIPVLLALLLGIQPVATDLYLSALPSIQGDLRATIGQTQQTLSTLILAFGASQLLLGPLSDRLGRKPVLLWGLAIFTLSAIAMAFVHSVVGLIALRALQGVGVGATVMSGRAVLRDLFAPERGAIVMSKAFSGLGLIAILCALLGSSVSQYLGWRYTLALMGVFGAALWLILLIKFQETLIVKNPQALHWRVLFTNWRLIVFHPAFLSYSMLCTFSFTALITVLSGSPFVLINMLGLSRLEFGFCLFFMPIFYIVGTFYCRKLLRRHGLQIAVKQATWLVLAPGLVMAIFALLGMQSLWHIIIPFYIFMIGHGVMQSSGQSGAVAHFPTKAGAASALNGFMMMAFAFGMTLWLGANLTDNASAMMLGMAFWCVLVSLVAWFIVPRFGELPA